jgi:hypothetical protein
MAWLVNATPRPLYPPEKFGTHCIRGWVGPRAGLDGCGKCRFDPRTSSQSLYQMSYLGPLLGHIVIHLFCPNYLTKGSARYFFWPGGSVKSCRYIKGVVNLESLGTADLYISSPDYYSYQKDDGARHENLQTKNDYFRYLGHWTEGT